MELISKIKQNLFKENDTSQKLFQFKSSWYVDGRSERIVIKGFESWVLKFISKNELYEIFKGYIQWREPQSPNKFMPGTAIGVWGRRNVSRFRRILRERGAEFKIINGEGPKQNIRSVHTIQGASLFPRSK